MMNRIVALISAALVGGALPASGAIPVIDKANLKQAIEITENTQSIMESDKQIMEYTQKTLAAVTGDRTNESGELKDMALGQFTMGAAPDLGSVISGGTLSFAGMGQGSQDVVSKLINGLQLVKSISGLIGDSKMPWDKSYESAVNTTATLLGLVDSTQGAVKDRTQAYQQGAQKIGQAKDLKGSIDQNSQIQAQNGLAINELMGVMNNAVTATNQMNLDYINRMSQLSRAMKIEKLFP